MKLFRFVALISMVFLVMAAWTQAPPLPSHDQQRRAVDAIRIVNTAELQYLNTAGHYGSLEDLRKSGALSEAHSMFRESPDISIPSDLPGFSIRLTTSPDGKRYQVSVIQEAKPETTLIGFFSDERGMIYEGHPI
jgi:hypothetical protein